MEFEFDSRDYIYSIDYYASMQQSAFDILLKNQWTKASETGVCRYQLPDLNTTVLPGKYGFVLQLNSKRAEQRRKPQNIQAVNVSFNPNEFNFNNVQDKEILIKLKWPQSSQSDENLIIINVSPLEFGNSLLVPYRKDCVPQKITLEGLDLVIKTMLLNNDLNFRAGFNSPGACCSVNHQHFHLYYLRQRLFIETAELEHIAGPCFVLKNFPSKGIVFQLENKDITRLAMNVFLLISYCLENEIPHNIFISRGTSYDKGAEGFYDTLRIFVWPRQPNFGVKDEYAFNAACCELSGHFLMKDDTSFKRTTEIELANRLTELTAPMFERIISEIPQLFGTNSEF